MVTIKCCAMSALHRLCCYFIADKNETNKCTGPEKKTIKLYDNNGGSNLPLHLFVRLAEKKTELNSSWDCSSWARKFAIIVSFFSTCCWYTKALSSAFFLVVFRLSLFAYLQLCHYENSWFAFCILFQMFFTWSFSMYVQRFIALSKSV